MAARASPKRVRAANFTEWEKKILFELLGKYKEVIENKGCDAVTVTEKNAAWEILCEEFNLRSPCIRRTPKSLKRCWENSKKTRRGLSQSNVKLESVPFAEDNPSQCILLSSETEEKIKVLENTSTLLSSEFNCEMNEELMEEKLEYCRLVQECVRQEAMLKREILIQRLQQEKLRTRILETQILSLHNNNRTKE